MKLVIDRPCFAFFDDEGSSVVETFENDPTTQRVSFQLFFGRISTMLAGGAADFVLDLVMDDDDLVNWSGVADNKDLELLRECAERIRQKLAASSRDI